MGFPGDSANSGWMDLVEVTPCSQSHPTGRGWWIVGGVVTKSEGSLASGVATRVEILNVGGHRVQRDCNGDSTFIYIH